MRRSRPDSSSPSSDRNRWSFRRPPWVAIFPLQPGAMMEAPVHLSARQSRGRFQRAFSAGIPVTPPHPVCPRKITFWRSAGPALVNYVAHPRRLLIREGAWQSAPSSRCGISAFPESQLSRLSFLSRLRGLARCVKACAPSARYRKISSEMDCFISRAGLTEPSTDGHVSSSSSAYVNDRVYLAVCGKELNCQKPSPLLRPRTKARDIDELQRTAGVGLFACTGRSRGLARCRARQHSRHWGSMVENG